MNRRDFIRNMGWSVLATASMIIAAASREPVYAGGKKGGRKSGTGKQSGASSNVSSTDLGSGRLKTNGNAGTSNVSGMDLGSGR